ncbi:MAG: efflux RND transporter periplasmic adaptor subunit [Gammaproteobacteria bacterium]|nr:efflux RND transporter periplasmic adaptor subunit [Gammaproteobacteria bacterium]
MLKTTHSNKQPGLVTSALTSNMQTFFKASVLSSAVILMAFASVNTVQAESGLQLNAEQTAALGLQTAVAKQVAHYPSAAYPALAMIPLKTIRTLSSSVSGTLSQLNVVHGPITKGQVIAEIESAELLAMQSDLLATQSSLSVAQTELKRAKKLAKSGISSAKKLQIAQAKVIELSALKAQQLGALRLAGMTESSIRTLRSRQTLQSSTLQIISPINGQLFNLAVTLGERVNVNQVLFSIGETDPMVLVVRVPVMVANQLREGQSVKVDGLEVEGIVEHIDPEVDAMTQSVDIHVEVENHDGKIRPGQLFELSFLMEEASSKQALFEVDSNAISQFEGETVVFVKQGNNIEPLAITVNNISQGRLYFSPIATDGTMKNETSVFIQGSTAIKLAFESLESDVEDSE